MGFVVTVDRKKFAESLLSLKKITKTRKPFEMILSYNNGFLLIQSVGGCKEIPAEGKARLDVHLPGEPMFKLAEVLPEISPFTLELAGGKLRMGPLLLPCTTADRKPYLIQVPVNPRDIHEAVSCSREKQGVIGQKGGAAPGAVWDQGERHCSIGGELSQEKRRALISLSPTC